MQPFSGNRKYGLSSLALAISAFFGVSAGQTARATPITYSLTTTASGELGTSAFTDAQVTITASADTSSIMAYFQPATSPNIFFLSDLSCSVFIAGLGTADFSIPTVVFLDNYTGVLTIQDSSGNAILSSQDVAAFSDYNLASSLGPVTGTSIQQSSGALFNSFETDDGEFSFSNLTTNTPTTFEALGVPDEGSTLGLLLLGLSSLAGHVWIQKIRRIPRTI